MTNEQLKKGEVLSTIMKTTEQELDNLKDLLDDVELTNKKKENFYDDGLYGLCISQYRDGSGYSAELMRYGGNLRLLKLIIKELELQLSEAKLEFENL
jgi:hypothetical protein